MQSALTIKSHPRGARGSVTGLSDLCDRPDLPEILLVTQPQGLPKSPVGPSTDFSQGSDRLQSEAITSEIIIPSKKVVTIRLVFAHRGDFWVRDAA